MVGKLLFIINITVQLAFIRSPGFKSEKRGCGQSERETTKTRKKKWDAHAQKAIRRCHPLSHVCGLCAIGITKPHAGLYYNIHEKKKQKQKKWKVTLRPSLICRGYYQYTERENEQRRESFAESQCFRVCCCCLAAGWRSSFSFSLLFSHRNK